MSGPANRSKVFWLGEARAASVYRDRVLQHFYHNDDAMLESRNKFPFNRNHSVAENVVDNKLGAVETIRDRSYRATTDFNPRTSYDANLTTLLDTINADGRIFPGVDSAEYGGLGGKLNTSLSEVVSAAGNAARIETEAAMSLAFSARLNARLDAVDAEISSASNLETADQNARADLTTLFEDIYTTLDSDTVDPDTGANENVADAIMRQADSSTETDVTDIFAKAETELTPDVKAMVEGAITNLTNNASGDIANIFSTALSTAQTAIDTDTTTVISDLVASFEKESTPTLMRSYNRFAGTAVDINSVHGSGFLIGMSNIERGFTADIEKFRSSVQLEVFTKVYSQYINAFNNAFDKYVTSYVQEKQQYLSTYSALIPEYLKIYLTNFTSRIQVYLAHITEFMQSQKSIIDNSTTKANTYISTQLDTIKTYISEYINSNIKMKLQTIGDEHTLLTNTAMHLSTQDLEKVKLRNREPEIELNLQTTVLDAKHRASDKTYEVEEKRAHWKIDEIARMGNILTIGRASGQVFPQKSGLAADLKVLDMLPKME